MPEKCNFAEVLKALQSCQAVRFLEREPPAQVAVTGYPEYFKEADNARTKLELCIIKCQLFFLKVD